MIEFKDVVAEFSARLRPMGFQKSGHLWCRRKGEIWQCLGLERSNFSRLFYVRLGVYIELLDKAKTGLSKMPLKMTSSCHLSADATSMMSRRGLGVRDEFVELTEFEGLDGQTLSGNIDDMFSYMDQYGLFKELDDVSTYQGIVSFIRDGKMSMTAFRTRHYLPKEILNFCLSRIVSSEA